MNKRLRIFVSGRVQGVFYRASACEFARALGLAGWARNLPDGRVEILAEGEEANLRALADWCRSGPILARVDRMETSEESPTGEFSEFRVRRDA